MDRWNALELLVLGVILFAYFVPIVSIPLPSNCVFCPRPQYGSLTYVFLGHGATWVAGIYSIRL
jgi:hypothetical protein